MTYKINLAIEKNELGYIASCPEITKEKFQGHSLDAVFKQIEEAVAEDLQKKQNETNQPIWEFAQDLIQDMTEEELNQLPSNGAEQHDHYIYGNSNQDK